MVLVAVGVGELKCCLLNRALAFCILGCSIYIYVFTRDPCIPHIPINYTCPHRVTVQSHMFQSSLVCLIHLFKRCWIEPLEMDAFPEDGGEQSLKLQAMRKHSDSAGETFPQGLPPHERQLGFCQSTVRLLVP